MPELPKSDWLTALGRTELFVSGAMALGGGAVYALYACNRLPNEAGVGFVVACAAVVGLFGAALFGTRSIKLANDYRRHVRVYSPFGKPFRKLSTEQKLYLTKLYRTLNSKRQFAEPEITPEILQLIDWGYIDKYDYQRGFDSRKAG